MIQKTQSTEGKVDKLELINIKNFGSMKYPEDENISHRLRERMYEPFTQQRTVFRIKNSQNSTNTSNAIRKDNILYREERKVANGT